MANPVINTYTGSAGGVVGTREDLSDVLSNISPVDTVFQKMCKKGSVKNKIYEWQTESLSNPSPSGAVEGADAPIADQALTTRQLNYTQIFTLSAKVNGTAEVTDKAGRGSEMAHQIINQTKQIKRNIETALTQQGVAFVGDTTSVPRSFKGLECWIGDNLSQPTAGTPVAPNPEANNGLGSGATDGTSEAFTEARLKTVLQSCYSSGGNPDTIMAGPSNRAVFSTFDGVSSAQNLDVNSGKIVGTMSVYESDWGTLKVVPNRFQRNKTVFVLDSSDFTLVTLRGLTTKDLPANGDYEAKQLITEIGLKVDNWHKHGAVRACS